MFVTGCIQQVCSRQHSQEHHPESVHWEQSGYLVAQLSVLNQRSRCDSKKQVERVMEVEVPARHSRSNSPRTRRQGIQVCHTLCV